MIEVRKLSKSFGRFKALENVNIDVKKGSVYGLLGPNGAGKTTLIKHLAGVYRQDAGTITIAGQPVYDNPAVKSFLVYIPDDLYFFSQYSIEETAQFYASFYPAWNWERYRVLKQVFSIDPRRRITRLSKGMQKQVAFWLGICVMPRVMILDEPVDGLDPVMRKKVWNLVLQDVAERETTVLVSSHNLRELEDVCDHVGILYNGTILVEKNLDDLKTDIHKLQVAFAGEVPPDLLRSGTILHREQNGSILLLVVKGDKEQILAEIRRANPVILDVLPLTLEEIFIYELGGSGYDIQNVLI
ncbi:MAG: acetoin utilization transport system ATP-binding protein [Moorella sp. (in: firmicutes)]|uniref:ABC transporter ATP-binding protein n=1 Tax=unclassified Neomoorella TaxID=2676739 RepID=UPI0010FFC644|nr:MULTISPECIES: ABC transporter ATP-binding protein [unclassified Moorella (in: firmicutes)]MDK2815586.1 acetoin utilization transport system ATP-binding protein [Moorella sp. (in: firmicutes)]GEA15141.1 ABC transporter ATP-binding protein [Moorella sp. E308F]GEA16947.1 ABC transporter ATP-binding protein [Moorella sp. E306M]